jgi:hypothetical protein
MEEINEVRKKNAPKLALTYENGFIGTENFSKNKLTDWEVKSSKRAEMEIQLTFEDPLWVSQNTLPCFIEIDFKDGEAFKSAGSGKLLAPNTKKRLRLDK